MFLGSYPSLCSCHFCLLSYPPPPPCTMWKATAWIELWLLQNFPSQIFSEPAGLSKTEQSSSRREWVRFGSPTGRDSQWKSATGYNQHQASRPVMLILLLPSNCWSLWAGGDVRLLFVSSRRCSTHLFFFVFLFFHIAFGASVSASSLCTHRRLNSLPRSCQDLAIGTAVSQALWKHWKYLSVWCVCFKGPFYDIRNC